MSLKDKLNQVIARHKELGGRLASSEPLEADAFAKASKEYSDLTPVAEAIMMLRETEKEYEDLLELLNDPESDKDLKDMAQVEAFSLKERLPTLEKAVKVLLIPKDAADEKNVILEIRAGTGGDEAALFASNLLRMYQRHSEIHKWKMEILDQTETGIGGIKDISVSISGKGVYARLKFESGVHRVQRVPETESGGRIHTSAATVAVLPEAEEVDVDINESDLRIDVYRASGAGGQHVNTTDSAVRITHLPTGIVVQQQSERSQHKNKAKALKVLRSRIYEVQREQAEAERASERKSLVGSGDRSERIRTYNYPQGRVTDHRINLTLYKLDQILEGSALDEVIDALVEEDQASKLLDF